MTINNTHFGMIYPDIHPQSPLSLSAPERIALTVSTGVLAFGAAYGHVIIAGAGAILMTFALLATSRKTVRRVRTEARERFPEQPWAEHSIAENLGLAWVLPIIWLFIATLCLLTLWFVPESFALTGATTVALISSTTIWFCPGLSLRWSANFHPSPGSDVEPSPEIPPH